MQHSFHCMNELCHCLNSLLILYCTHGTAAGFVAGAKQFKPSISIQIYLYAAFPPPNTLYNMASGHDFKICSLASSFSSLSVTSGSSLAKKKLRRFALDKRHLVCDFRNKKRPIDFHLSMKHAWMHAWWFCESEWVWIPHIVKNDEVLNYTERHNELSDPPICHLSLVCSLTLSWMHAWVRHTSSVMYFSTVAISITIQSGIPFECWAELSEVTEQLGVEEECEHYYCNYI